VAVDDPSPPHAPLTGVRLRSRRSVERVGDLVLDIVLGVAVGLLAGLSSAGFLVTLGWATDYREDHGWIVWLLPLAGFAIGLAYHHLAGDAVQGNNLIIDEIHEDPARAAESGTAARAAESGTAARAAESGRPDRAAAEGVSWIPRRMAPLVYAGTIVTHLFGGSAGREGTALQMSGSLTDLMNRVLGIRGSRRRRLLIAALGGGFGAVFGVPIAGAVFGLEVQAVGRVRYDAIVPCLTASVVGDLVVRGLGVHHTPLPHIDAVHIDAALLAKVIVAGLAFGITGLVFMALTHRIGLTLARFVRWSPLRTALGGAGVLVLMVAVGNRDYLGLSLPLITDALDPAIGVVTFAFALKLLFTAVTIGSGFPGGEVTPLFVIGATLGATLGTALGVPGPLMAALGFVAVFSGAANVPLAGTIMGVELFGGDAVVLFAVVCVVAYVSSSHRSLYRAQRRAELSSS
jgi:H+/Cl- antiporter ClcA